MVRIAGLEPARLAALPPQSSVSANSTICAHGSHNEAAARTPRKPNQLAQTHRFGQYKLGGYEPSQKALQHFYNLFTIV